MWHYGSVQRSIAIVIVTVIVITELGSAFAQSNAGGEKHVVFHETPSFTKAFKQLHPGLTTTEVAALLGPAPTVIQEVTYEKPLSAKRGVVLVHVIDYDESNEIASFQINLGPDGSRPMSAYDLYTLRENVFDRELTARYAALKALTTGLSRAEAEKILQLPVKHVELLWMYSEARAPRVGESLSIYQIHFGSDGKLRQAEQLPGACATGPPH